MNTTEFGGMKIEAARIAAQQAGFEVKIVTSGVQTLSNDFRMGRITFNVVDGIVTSANIG